MPAHKKQQYTRLPISLINHCHFSIFVLLSLCLKLRPLLVVLLLLHCTLQKWQFSLYHFSRSLFFCIQFTNSIATTTKSSNVLGGRSIPGNIHQVSCSSCCCVVFTLLLLLKSNPEWISTKISSPSSSTLHSSIASRACVYIFISHWLFVKVAALAQRKRANSLSVIKWKRKPTYKTHVYACTNRVFGKSLFVV